MNTGTLWRYVLVGLAVFGLVTAFAWSYPACQSGCIDANSSGCHSAFNEFPKRHECHVHADQINYTESYGGCCGLVGGRSTQFTRKHWFDVNGDGIADAECHWKHSHYDPGC